MPLYSATAVFKDYKAYIVHTGGPDKVAKFQVFVMIFLSGQSMLLAVHEITGGRLTLVGGSETTNKHSKRLFSFIETNGLWASHFPDMPKPHNRCSVVTHSNNVIIAGGTIIGDACSSSIEVMSITELSWREVASQLLLMLCNMLTIVCNIYNGMYIIGYAGSDNMHYQVAYTT